MSEMDGVDERQQESKDCYLLARELAELMGLSPETKQSEIMRVAKNTLALSLPDIWGGLMQEADRVAAAKGKDYTKGSGDHLANFKNSGADAGITPLQAWLVFYNKHHSAICSYIRSNGQSESEPIKDRFVDALNYLRLGWLLVLDTKENASKAIEGTL